MQDLLEITMVGFFLAASLGMLIISFGLLYWRYRWTLTTKVGTLFFVSSGGAGIVGIAMGRVYSNTLIDVPFMILVGSIVLGALLIVVYTLNGWFFEPIKLLARASKIIARGNLEAELPEYNKEDEIGDLSRAFRTLLQFLQSSIELIELTSHQVAEAAQELASATKEIEEGTQEISALAKQAVRETQRQADNINEAADQIRTLKQQTNDQIQSFTSTVELIKTLSNRVTTLAFSPSPEAAPTGEYIQRAAKKETVIRPLIDKLEQHTAQITHRFASCRITIFNDLDQLTNRMQDVTISSQTMVVSTKKTSFVTGELFAAIKEIFIFANELMELSNDLLLVLRETFTIF